LWSGGWGTWGAPLRGTGGGEKTANSLLSKKESDGERSIEAAVDREPELLFEGRKGADESV